MQTLPECGQPVGLLVRECDAEKSNQGPCRLLRARRKRPCSRAAEQRDERAAVHSIIAATAPTAAPKMALGLSRIISSASARNRS